MSWLISDSKTNFEPHLTGGRFSLYLWGENSTYSSPDKKLFFLIDGYILPRVNFVSEYIGLSQIQLLLNLYTEVGLDFINKIKGVFNIVIIHDEKFYIFNDHHGFKKFFFVDEQDCFSVSNSLTNILKIHDGKESGESIALFILFNHFVFGETLYNKVKFSHPAMSVSYERELKKSIYWNVSDLFSPKEFISDEEFAKSWLKIITEHINFLKPEQISVTLTGGNDSRMVLAGLLASGQSPKSFTFGNPNSGDGKISKEIADKTGLNHRNYGFVSLNKEWFEGLADRIISFGNSMVNIHRAHRLDAIERDTNSVTNGMLFTGLVGGEYIKEPAYNDITIPKLFLEISTHEGREQKMKYIKRVLTDKGIITEKIDIEKILDLILDFLQKTVGYSENQKKFLLTYYFYATIHHSQDPVVFGTGFKFVINPFTDIDFLELLGRSPHWYPNKKNWLGSKVFHSYLLVKVTDILAPQLSEINFAKKGEYSGKDLLNSPIRYLIKRGLAIALRRGKVVPQNFPIGEWMYEFVENQVVHLHPRLLSFVKKDFLFQKLTMIKHSTTEESWHPVTSFVNISMNMKFNEKV